MSTSDSPRILAESEVDKVWSGHVVGFCLYTCPPYQFAAYYNSERRMTIARRKLDETDWARIYLPENLLWDSHNSVTLALDNDNCVHVSGNMHVDPLVYFRSEKPFDIESLARYAMVGEREQRCTYPVFQRGPGGKFLFLYRDGQSGNGDQIYNIYDEASKKWSRLLDSPLTYGEDKMNAYFNGPKLGPDGRYHLCWVWRDEFGCETNHDPCYARSADLVHWENSEGKPYTLPITLETAEIIDPIPAKGGVINGNVVLGFDSQKRPVVTYHKYDAAGNTQVFDARYENGKWETHQISDWDYRWDFSGGGTINFEVKLSGVSPAGNGRLKQTFTHSKKGSGGWFVDEATLKPLGSLPQDDASTTFPQEMTKKQSSFPGVEIRRAADSGSSGAPGVSYVMQWETLGSNRDKPIKGPIPEPSALRIFKIQ
jgi:hypothetical protein